MKRGGKRLGNGKPLGNELGNRLQVKGSPTVPAIPKLGNLSQTPPFPNFPIPPFRGIGKGNGKPRETWNCLATPAEDKPIAGEEAREAFRAGFKTAGGDLARFDRVGRLAASARRPRKGETRAALEAFAPEGRAPTGGDDD